MLRRIKYFLAIVKCGGLKEVAEKTFVPQTVIAKEIRALELDIGIELFLRKGGQYSLTAAGECYYNAIVPMLSEYERAFMEALGVARSDKPQIHLGCLCGYNDRKFQRALDKFHVNSPQVDVKVIDDTYDRLFDDLDCGRIDMVFSNVNQIFCAAFEYKELDRRVYYVLAPERSALTQSAGVEVSHLADTTCVIMADKQQDRNMRRYYHDILGIKGRLLFAKSWEESIELVRNDGGCIITEDIGKEAPSFMRILLLKDNQPIYKDYCIYWRSDNQSPYISDFLNKIKSQFPVHSLNI